MGFMNQVGRMVLRHRKGYLHFAGSKISTSRTRPVRQIRQSSTLVDSRSNNSLLDKARMKGKDLPVSGDYQGPLLWINQGSKLE